jgi:phage tail sheath protein FI
MGGAEETHDNVNLGKRGKSVVETITANSKLVTVVEEQAPGPLAEKVPEVGTYLIRAQQTAIQPKLLPSDFTGDVTERSGMEGLQIAEDVTMVACPDLMAAYQAGAIDKVGVQTVQLAMINHCELMGDRVALIDPLPDLSPQEVKKWKAESQFDSKYAALYYPWIQVGGPDGKPLAVPPSGHVAGIYARNDTERGVHKAPANEVVRGALAAATQVTKGEQDTLNPDGINCIRSFVGRGVRVWGARTLSNDPAWRYVNVRRLFNYVEKSIELGTQWVVFEPNDPALWARIRRDIGAFLTGL